MGNSSKPKRGLGRGLSALMADTNISKSAQNLDEPAKKQPDTELPIEKLRPNPDQPRRDFDNTELEELAASIREKGIIQPLLVRRDPQNPDDYQIIAGERRWRAAQLANLHDIPVLIRELNDTEVIEVAIIENIQRADLNAVEEAAGYRQLMEKFGHTQEKLAEALGKSRSHIANLLRLLSLPQDVLDLLRDGKLSAGHARALVTAENPSVLARRIVASGLSVRQAEKLAKGRVDKSDSSSKNKPVKDADTKALEQDLSANIGLKVEIDHHAGKQSGVVRISYETLDELDELCQQLTFTEGKA